MQEHQQAKNKEQLPLLPAPKSRKKVYVGIIILIVLAVSLLYYFSYQRISRVEKRIEEMQELRDNLQKAVENMSKAGQ